MKPTVKDVIPLVRAIYSRHAAGCCLHILTDDGNVKQIDVDFCLTRARQAGHPDCQRAAELLAQMSQTQRRRIYLEH